MLSVTITSQASGKSCMVLPRLPVSHVDRAVPLQDWSRKQGPYVVPRPSLSSHSVELLLVAKMDKNASNHILNKFPAL